MRDKKKYGNQYYVELFKVDMKSYEYIYSVGIDLITNKYITEYSRCIENSFVTYSEETYTRIDYKRYLELLEQAFTNKYVSEERYSYLKQKAEPDLKSVEDLAECYEKIAKRDIEKIKKHIRIPSKLEIDNQHVYQNYDKFCDKNDFIKLYLNRYSKNQGWCIRLVQNDEGFKLNVIYSTNKLPDLYEESEYRRFQIKYNSDFEFYRDFDVYEKQITEWEKKYLIHLLEEEQFYELLDNKMKLNNSKTVGYIGSCEIKVKYKIKTLWKECEKEIHGFTENDDKSACGIDFYEFILKCLNLVQYQSKIVNYEEENE